MNDRDYELITAYIDGALTEAERKMFEARLSAEPELRSELNSLRQTVTMLHQLPGLKAPRNFTLTKAQVESRPAARTPLPFPLTATFSALSAAAAVLMLLFGGYFLLQTNMMPTASNLAPVQQEAQESALTSVALASTATDLPSATPMSTATSLPSPMPTMPPPTEVANQAQSESAPSAAMAPPAEELEDATIMMFGEASATSTPDADEETAAFRLAVTEIPATLESFEMDGAAADMATGGAGAVMMATQAILAPNPLMTDAAIFATLGANFAQYGETALPPTVQPETQTDDASTLAEPSQAMQAEATSPQDGVLQTGADERDDFAESEAPGRVQSAPVTDTTGLLLVGVGGLLLVIAIVTTIIRRQRTTL